MQRRHIGGLLTGNINAGQAADQEWAKYAQKPGTGNLQEGKRIDHAKKQSIALPFSAGHCG